MKSLAALLFVLVATGLSKTNAAPAPPPLTHLLTANVTAGPTISIGTEPAGTRVVYPISGGTFAGPLLNGTVAHVGADFTLTSPSNVFSPNGVLILQTSDGTNIIYRDKGYQSGTYLYGSVTFETGSGHYDWLNTVVAVSTSEVSFGDTSTEVTINVFVVTYSPRRYRDVVNLNTNFDPGGFGECLKKGRPCLDALEKAQTAHVEKPIFECNEVRA